MQKIWFVTGASRGFGAEIAKAALRSGDRVVMFTDGVSEAVDGEGEEFGEERLAEASRCGRELSADALHRRLLEGVTEFCGGESDDDFGR